MSSEQFTIPTSNQSTPQYSETTLVGGRTGETIMSYDEYKARADIEALTRTAAPVATEALKSHIERAKLSPQQEIAVISRQILHLRQGLEKFDLDPDHQDPINLKLFEAATKDDYDQAA